MSDHTKGLKPTSGPDDDDRRKGWIGGESIVKLVEKPFRIRDQASFEKSSSNRFYNREAPRLKRGDAQ